MVAGLMLAEPARGAAPLPTLNCPYPSQHEGFGVVVAGWDDLAIVGDHGRATSIGTYGEAHVFDVTTGELRYTLKNPFPPIDGPEGPIRLTSAGVGLDDTFAYLGISATSRVPVGPAIVVFDVATGTQLRVLRGPEGIDEFGGLIAAESGTVATTGYLSVDGTATSYVFVYDAITGGLRYSLTSGNPFHQDRFPSDIAVNDGRLLVAGKNFVVLYDLLTGSLIRRIDIPTTLALSRVELAGNLAIVGHEFGGVEVVDVDTGARLQYFPDVSPSIFAVVGGALALKAKVPSAGRYIYLVDPETGEVLDRPVAAPAPCCDTYVLAGAGNHLLVPRYPYPNTVSVFAAPVCGNGVVEGVETCDGGHSAADCCTDACSFERAGARCSNDVDLCDAGTCDAGVCRPGPWPGCASLPSTSARVRRVRNGAGLTWRGLTASEQTLGDPTDDTDYALCGWDAGSGGARLDLMAPAASLCGAGACWRTARNGLTYRRPRVALRKVLLRTTSGGRTRLDLRAQLDDVGEPLHLELRNAAGGCWQASSVGAFVQRAR